MARWQPVPVAGGAYSDDTKPWTAQDTVNRLPVSAERPGTRSDAILRDCPGALSMGSLGDSPIRGLHDAEGLLIAVCGRVLYTITGNGTATARGIIPGVGRCSISHNQITGGNEVFIANGLSAYVYNTKTTTLSQISDGGFPGAKVGDFVDGYIVFVEPGGRFWGWSDLADATSYNTLDRSEAESQPDKIVSLVVSHREVMVLGERTGEFYRNTGAATGTFQRIDGTEMEVGCASTFSVAKLDNSVFWLGHDGIVYRLNGYQPVRISTHAIEQAISRCEMRAAYAFTFEDRGHKVYYLTFTDGQTWGYDVATGEWHRRVSEGLDFWRMAHMVRWNKRWICSSYASGTLYQQDWATSNEAGDELVRTRTFAVLHDNQNRVIVNAVELVYDTGATLPAATPVTLAIAPVVASGDIPDGFVGDAVSGSYTAYGGNGVYTYAVTAGSLPPGATMTAGGVYSGTFTTQGSYSWTVTVTDGNGATDTVADTAVVTLELLGPQLSDWRYLQIDAADATDYSDPNFDDSAWATGPAPFGSWEAGYGAPEMAAGAPDGLIAATDYDARFATNFATTWDTNTRLWLRRTLTLDQVPAGGIQIVSYMDDNYLFYVNGVLLVTSTSGGTGGGGATFTIDAADLVAGENVIAIRCDDEAPSGSASVVYADFILEGLS